MGDLVGPLTTDGFTSNHVYQTDDYNVNGDSVHLRIVVFSDPEKGFDVNYRYYTNGQPGELSSTHTDNSDTATRLFWHRLSKLPSYTEMYELYITPDNNEARQGERNVMTKPATEKSKADNIQEGNSKPREEKKEPANIERPEVEKPETEGQKGIDWKVTGESAGETILKGAGVAAVGAGLVAAGVVSAPFLIGAGIAFSVGMGINTFFTRANEAMDAGEEEYLGRAATAGISDMIPIVDVIGIGEAASGYNYMTGKEMTQEERSIKTGQVFGAMVMDVAPGAGAKLGSSKSAKQGIRAIKRAYTDSGIEKAMKSPKRGLIIIPFGSSSKPTKLSKKIGAKPEDIHYTESISTDKFLKTVKRGQKTGMDSNHLLLSEWFEKGPAYIKGMQHYVPSNLLANGMEHQGTFHGAFNEFMRKNGLFQKPKYSQVEIEKAMMLAEKFYLQNPGGDLGKEMAAACRSFRINIFKLVKK